MVQTTQIKILNDKINITDVVPRSKIISLNIKNIYNSISKPNALKLLKNQLIHYNNFDSEEIDEIIYYINIIIDQNDFEYNNNKHF